MRTTETESDHELIKPMSEKRRAISNTSIFLMIILVLLIVLLVIPDSSKVASHNWNATFEEFDDDATFDDEPPIAKPLF